MAHDSNAPRATDTCRPAWLLLRRRNGNGTSLRRHLGSRQTHHRSLEVLVDGADHKLTTWNVETSSMTILARRGWKTGLIHVGDKVSISGHPHKTDPLEIYVREITLKDGTTFGDPTGKDQALD
jgi:hypothetical protein